MGNRDVIYVCQVKGEDLPRYQYILTCHEKKHVASGWWTASDGFWTLERKYYNSDGRNGCRGRSFEKNTSSSITVGPYVEERGRRLAAHPAFARTCDEVARAQSNSRVEE